jgi:hypothetical protein
MGRGSIEKEGVIQKKVEERQGTRKINLRKRPSSEDFSRKVCFKITQTERNKHRKFEIYFLTKISRKKEDVHLVLVTSHRTKS